MKVKEARAGGLCRSTRGRDSGRLYVIAAAGEGTLSLADGRSRTVADPKRKNVKHVALLPEFYGGDMGAKGADERIAAWLDALADRYGG